MTDDCPVLTREMAKALVLVVSEEEPVAEVGDDCPKLPDDVIVVRRTDSPDMPGVITSTEKGRNLPEFFPLTPVSSL